jgi:hypothetical protein
MDVFSKLLGSIDKFFSRQERKRDEAYLAESQNVADLERRMRKWEFHPNTFWN